MSRLNLPAPIGKDGRPYGTKCAVDCPAVKGLEAHCTVCHNTFSGVTYFDAHRSDGYCHNPASLGLQLQDALWATPEGHEARKAASERMATARAGRGKDKEASA